MKSYLLLSVVVIAALLIAWSTTSTAQTSRILQFVEHADNDAFVDNGPKGDSVGDMVISANAVFDKTNKKKVGTDNGYCVRTVVHQVFECIFTLILADGGTITFNCGPALIHLSSTKYISAQTTIDGGGQITLSGDNVRRLFWINAGTALTLRNIVLTNGFNSGDGGAIVNNGALTLENSAIRNSEAGGSGGAIISYGPLHIINSVLEDNRALNGGALYPRFSNAQTVIVNSVLSNNHATGYQPNGWSGAILAWDGARLTIQGSDIYSNTAYIGGGIYNFANSVLFLVNMRLRDNVVVHEGGGIFNEGTATLTNVTLSDNWGQGGGIMNEGTATLTNVTLSGNLATGGGGGIYNCAIGSLMVKNTLVANSPQGGNCTGVVTHSGFNLSSDGSCGFGNGRDYVNVMLGPLADNGGPTQTHMPQPGSPAIDRGSGCPATDQRGVARPIGPACDVGAVEYGTVVEAPESGNIYLPLVQK